jgi:hypothetical protein
MTRGFKEIELGANLNDTAQIHHCYAMANVCHHSQIMGNEHKAEAMLLLKALKEVNDLALNGNIESRDRFVCNNHLGLNCKGTGYPYALALSARELMGKSFPRAGIESYLVEKLADARFAG